MKIKFNGAARIVTGSCYLIEVSGRKFLVDCGLFQGREDIEKLNYEKFQFDPGEIEFVILTHAHLDHCGLLPKLVKYGFKGKIWTTKTTKDLVEVMLLDATKVQQRNKEERGKEIIYDEIDVKRTLARIKGVEYDKEYEIVNGVSVKFTLRDAGHILGSSIVEVYVEDNGEKKKIVFSGDLGQRNMPIVKDPTPIKEADYLVIESTYGDRIHEDAETKEEKLKNMIKKVYERKGKLFIPSFALERTQELLYRIKKMLERGDLDYIDVYLDSPLALKATEIFKKHLEDYDKETAETKNPFGFKGLHIITSVQESKRLNKMSGPFVVIAGSGMCTGGRILHHIRNGIEDPKNALLFVGYQAEGTLGRKIKDGAKEIKLFGETLQVKAEIESIDGFSAHADYRDLLWWVSNFEKKPKKIFVTHGEEKSSLSFKEKLEERGFNAYVPHIYEEIEI